MYLDREQESALNGELGPAIAWAMDVLVQLGDRAESNRLIPVTSVHIPDWCGEHSSEAWASLGSMVTNAAFPVTANPWGLEIPMIERKKVLERLRPHGTYSFSCAPYLYGNHPGKGKVVAWGGRAASAFANSILGARTEVESFESAVASAITALTPERGLHLEENRSPTVAVTVPRVGRIDYSMLGWVLSHQLKGEVPQLCNVSPTFDEAKRLAFNLNSQGTIPLFELHRGTASPTLEAIEVDDSLSWDSSLSPDLVVVGCPHLSEQQINHWSKKLSGRLASGTEAWFFTSRLCLDKCPVFGAVLHSRGKVIVDLCPLAMKEELVGRAVACDSPALAECLKNSGIAASYFSDIEILSFLTS